MNRITATQAAAMIKADRQGPVVVINAMTARALIASGHMRQAGQPLAKGVAVELTAKGRAWVGA